MNILDSSVILAYLRKEKGGEKLKKLESDLEELHKKKREEFSSKNL